MKPLQITINSFSYKKGFPEDTSGNGGGFMFDCRGIYNPGRLEDYKKLSGLDIEVQEFLRSKTEMNTFLAYIFKMIEIPVEDYIKREFEHLQINFGCTGGQHRSVYGAIKTAEYLKNKYPEVEISVAHTNQHNWPK